MFNKVLMAFISFSSFVHCINPAKVETNETMMNIIIRDFENILTSGKKGRKIKLIIYDAEKIGIDLLMHIENSELKFKNGAIKALENGGIYSYEKICKYGGKYNVKIDMTNEDIQKIAQKGIENAFRKSSCHEIEEFISFSNNHDIELLINEKTILEPLKEGLQNSIAKHFKVKKKLLLLAKDYGITLSKTDLNEAIEKGIIRLLTSNKKFYIEDHPSVRNFKKIEKSCLENDIDFNIADIAGIEALIYKNFECFIHPKAIDYFNERGIEIDFSKIENLKKILENETIYTYDSDLERYMFGYNQNKCYKKSKRFEFINDIAEKNGIKINPENIRPQLQKIIEIILKTAVERNKVEKIEFLINLAQENGIEITPYLLEVINKNIIKKMYEHICWSYSKEKLSKTISTASSYGATLDFHEIIKEAMRKEMSRAEIEDLEKIMNYVEVNKMALSMKDLRPEDILKGLVRGVENTNIVQIHDFMTYTEENGYICDINKGFLETAKIYIETGNIEKILYLIDFAKELNIEIDLKEILDIENVFYVGIENAIKHKSYFVYQYLLQLAKDNDIALNNEKLKIFEEEALVLRPYFDDFRLFVYPDYILDYLIMLTTP